MKRLPAPLLSSILAVAVPGYSEDLVPYKRKLPGELLKALALVCKAWLAVIKDIVSRFQASTLTLHFQTGSESELLEIQRQASDKGSQVVDLRICIGNLVPRPGFYRNSDAISLCKRDAPPLDGVDLGWDSLFQSFTNLKRLDLTLMTLESPHVKGIVEAAGKHCLHLEALVLPGRFRAISQFVPPDPIVLVDSTLAAVYKAAEHWWRAGDQRGLRQLTIPTLNYDNCFTSCAEFIRNVVKYCPTVEYLDGYVHSVRDTDVLTCRTFWPLTVNLWGDFCATCTNLREFNWVIAPFGDPFFEIFGATVKPHLKKLTFGINMFWDWEYYFRCCDEASGVERNAAASSTRPGYGVNATRVASALEGCPALEELRVNLDNPVDPEHRGFIIAANNDQRLFPLDEVVNMDAFDDRLCETLATYCPLVSCVEIKEVAPGLNRSLSPIQTFTDAGLEYLAKLKFLKTLHLRPISCTAKGLLKFLNNLSDEFAGQRTFELAVAGKARALSMDFYVFLQELLRLLGDATPHELACAQQKFVLRVINSGEAVMQSVWGESYLSSLKSIIEKVTRIHESLRLRVVSARKRGTTEFATILEFGIYTLSGEPSPSYGWGRSESNKIFVVKTYDYTSD